MMNDDHDEVKLQLIMLHDRYKLLAFRTSDL